MTTASAPSVRSLISRRRTRLLTCQIPEDTLADESTTAPNEKKQKKKNNKTTFRDSIHNTRDRSQAISWLPRGRTRSSCASSPAMVYRGEDVHDITTPLPPLPALAYRPLSQTPRNIDIFADFSLGLSETLPPRPHSNPSRRSSSAVPDDNLDTPQEDPSTPRRPSRHRRITSDPGKDKADQSTKALQRVSIRQSQDWSADIQQLIRETDQAFDSANGLPDFSFPPVEPTTIQQPELFQPIIYDEPVLLQPRAYEATRPVYSREPEAVDPVQDWTPELPPRTESRTPKPKHTHHRRPEPKRAHSRTPETTRKPVNNRALQPPKHSAHRPAPHRITTKERNKELPAAPKSTTPEPVPQQPQPQQQQQQVAKPPPPPPAPTKQVKAKKVEKSHAWPGMLNSKTSKWNIPENVADILSGHRFKRIEADEMLTPARIEELKRAREEAKNRKAEVARTRKLKQMLEPPPRRSSDSSASAESDSSARSAASSKSSAHEDDMPPPDKAATSLEDTLPSLPSATANLESQRSANASPAQVDGGAPILPPRNPERSASPMICIEDEDVECDIQRRPSRSKNLSHEENDEFVYLKSTPYTLTKPLFMHGPIAFSKAEIGRGAMTMDETLDWSAFQMAILGGAGEFLQTHVEEGEDRVADDVAAWFDTFGFETHGELVPEPTPSLRRGTISSNSSASNSDTDLPIPVSTDDYFAGGGWNPSSGVPLESVKFMSTSSMKRWQLDDHARQHDATGPLVVGEPGDINESAAGEAQMGCNMTQDLGDFLRWEAQHMSGNYM